MLHIEFKLDTAPAYMGVSYVWGSLNPQKLVCCNRKQLCISTNCESALSAIFQYHIEAETWLWIDQICIDQQNMVEKSQQISMMPDIYGRAQVTA
jgi:hypothetical protein